MGLAKRSYTCAGLNLFGFRPHSLGAQVQAETPSCPKEGKHIDYKGILDLIWGIERSNSMGLPAQYPAQSQPRPRKVWFLQSLSTVWAQQSQQQLRLQGLMQTDQFPWAGGRRLLGLNCWLAGLTAVPLPAYTCA